MSQKEIAGLSLMEVHKDGFIPCIELAGDGQTAYGNGKISSLDEGIDVNLKVDRILRHFG
jgi:hypothetical protein